MSFDRRRAMRLAALAMAAPAALAAPLRALALGRAIVPPDAPMVYSRRLEREMRGGARFTVARSFAVRFHEEGAGFRLEGEQLSVSVEAPEELAEFARLERERRENNLFPLRLDALGQIEGEGPRTPADALDAAVAEALRQLAAEPMAGDEQAEAMRFVRAIQQGAARIVTELPRDLFAPLELRREERRPVALPGGRAGEVSLTFVAETDPATGLMRSASRVIATELAGTRRTAREEWALAFT